MQDGNVHIMQQILILNIYYTLKLYGANLLCAE